ncbi:hypothetical protein PVK06_020861 [Gossypium arboreum]|uniref:Uncharacterized protein n=1 Tax=Gossypium arboreum TaxID=29729 RepID=A0ABR0PNG2_GOSAR|nr:hypothetical protein PVK06_020861 [Gossypium arboreum]
MHLRLDADIQKLEVKNLRKGKRKVEEDLDSLKTDYKKLHMSMRTAGLGKSSEQWRQEVQEEKARADQWEKRFYDARARENALKKSLVEGQCEKEMLVARVAELKKALRQHRGRNSDIELRASLSRIKDLKGKDQVKDRDHIMGEAIAQIREVVNHLQTLAVQADVLSVKYELESDRGRELACLFKKVKTLGIRAKSYI